MVRYRHHLTWKYFVINLMDYTDSLSYLCILLVSCQYQSINADAILHNHNIPYVPRVVQHLYLMLINCYYDLEMSFDECLILLIFNCTPCLQTILFTNTLIKSLCHCYAHTHIYSSLHCCFCRLTVTHTHIYSSLHCCFCRLTVTHTHIYSSLHCCFCRLTVTHTHIYSSLHCCFCRLCQDDTHMLLHNYNDTQHYLN